MNSDAPPLHRAHPKKSWRYVLEFLMLFLAVFCGFIAENWREQRVDNQLEKEYMYSIVEDIKSDIRQSNEVLNQLHRKVAGTDSLMILLSSPEILENSSKAYDLWNTNMGFEDFISNDRTIQQLKNSGGMRLIRNKAVSDSIISYDQTLRNYYVQADAMLHIVTNRQIYNQLFDFIGLKTNATIPVPLTEQGKRLLNEAYADRKIWNYGISALINRLREVNEQGKRIVDFIQDEYKL
jgi:hypothetical protein